MDVMLNHSTPKKFNIYIYIYNMPIGTPKILVICSYKDSENNDRERTIYITLYMKTYQTSDQNRSISFSLEFLMECK
jgi:hypothetical protein